MYVTYISYVVTHIKIQISVIGLGHPVYTPIAVLKNLSLNSRKWNIAASCQEINTQEPSKQESKQTTSEEDPFQKIHKNFAPHTVIQMTLPRHYLRAHYHLFTS